VAVPALVEECVVSQCQPWAGQCVQAGAGAHGDGKRGVGSGTVRGALEGRVQPGELSVGQCPGTVELEMGEDAVVHARWWKG